MTWITDKWSKRRVSHIEVRNTIRGCSPAIAEYSIFVRCFNAFFSTIKSRVFFNYGVQQLYLYASRVGFVVTCKNSNELVS